MVDTQTIGELAALEAAGDYGALIRAMRETVAADTRACADPWVKGWCSRRWRHLFVAAAAEDEKAVSTASQRLKVPGTDLSVATRLDRRPTRQRVAERFLRLPAPSDWTPEQPPADMDGFDATVLVCPGLLTGMLPDRAFQNEVPALHEKHGWRFLAADSHPLRSCEANTDDLLAALERGEGHDETYRRVPPGEGTPPGDVVLLCYSKGAVDALTLLARRPDLAARVKAVYFWGGAIGGSISADSLYGVLKDMEVPKGLNDIARQMMKTFFPVLSLDRLSERIDEYDVKGALLDLTTTRRAEFLAEHGEAVDALSVPMFNLTGATSALEVPAFQLQAYLDIKRTLGDADNDMQVAQQHARMTTPMATDLAVLHAHHWDLSYGPFPKPLRLAFPNLANPFPRAAAVRAIVELTAELGLA